MTKNLKPHQLQKVTDENLFDFKSSNDLLPAMACVGQNEAATALRRALSIPGQGYHVIAVGKEGTGRLECIYSVINELELPAPANVDRVLLPVRGQHDAYEETQLKTGGASYFITACSSIIKASIEANTESRSLELKTLLEKFAGRPLLSSYLQWLDDETSMILDHVQHKNEISKTQHYELQGMLPLLLHSNPHLKKNYLYDSLPDLFSLLGTFVVDSENGRITIHGGTLVQASSGFLIIDGSSLALNKAHWQLLRGILKTGLIPLSAIPSAASSRRSLDVCDLKLSGEIRLTCKVILFCDSATLDALIDADPEIENIFSKVIEFESEMERSDENVLVAASLISRLVSKLDCLPLDPKAMAAMIDVSARAAGSQNRLTLNRAVLSKYLREASMLVSQAGNEIISRRQIKSVVAMDRNRLIVDQRDALEAILNEETRVELAGNVIGQINGLTIVGTGFQSYLEPSRITATVRAGDGAVVDIEREVNLGGSIHSKGVMILTSLLASRYSRHSPLSLIATLVFEQSYSDVDGDSASAAEIMAILSAVAEIPIRQELAVTGSIDQRGQILCVGDINCKIEGYYRLVKLHGDLHEAGVVIPSSNLNDLMLNDELVVDVAHGKFKIFAVSTLDELIELLTGMKAGEEGERGEFPAGSFNARVHASLKQFSDEKKEDHKDS